MKPTFDLYSFVKLAGAVCFMLLMNPAYSEEKSQFLAKVIAHRGASFEAPENTRAAIQLAIDKKAEVIEFDVRETSDGKLFLFHDHELKRLYKSKGVFEKLTSTQASKLDVGSWFTKASFPNETPPTLTEAIQQCLDANCIPLIEHKSGKPENYSKVIKDLNATDRVIVQSFDWKFIKSIRELMPALKVGALGSRSLSDRKEELLDLKPNWVGWGDRDIKTEDIVWLQTNGFKIAIWTVNDRKRAQLLVSKGVDRIITDRPKYIAEGLAGK